MLIYHACSWTVSQEMRSHIHRLPHKNTRHLRCWFTLDPLADKLLSCCSQVHIATVCVCVTTSLIHTSLWEDTHSSKHKILLRKLWWCRGHMLTPPHTGRCCKCQCSLFFSLSCFYERLFFVFICTYASCHINLTAMRVRNVFDKTTYTLLL